jgi:hypothetical protein
MNHVVLVSLQNSNEFHPKPPAKSAAMDAPPQFLDLFIERPRQTREYAEIKAEARSIKMPHQLQRPQLRASPVHPAKYVKDSGCHGQSQRVSTC